MRRSEHVLVSYGTLRPGYENHHVVEGIPGKWQPARIEGVIDQRGRYPRYRYVRNGRWVNVEVFVSTSLPHHWTRLDRFEGPSYRRVSVPVRLEGRTIYGYVYEDARS
jgi:gamma-glutamylcyclotransferase (GGCT)/AIG2-like uncharacterized protein YtfP